ncbi:NAD(+) diphosphatase [Bifidobacterium choloepi]|uniref:NAD(+) diphosphatase n=1 Tax=Bifidobacterium choloepi TaxID=2614131 RepID=A0A6I5N1M3_9BIFI|nr:NAD(+) diphosphatase [Bifidobacterium choloepi]NEG70376.1 NAD(+) diphosphatase [Bifidobacterium choloepi]
MAQFSSLALTQALPFLPLAQGDIDYQVERRGEPDLIETVLLNPATKVILVRDGLLAVPFGQSNIVNHAAVKMRLAALPGAYVAAELRRHPEVVAMFLGSYGGARNEEVVAVDITDIRPLSRDSSFSVDARFDDSDIAGAIEGSASFEGGVPAGAGAVGAGAGAPGAAGSRAGRSAGRYESLLETATERFDWVDLRGFAPHASAREVGQATTAVSLGGWHEVQHHCPACGAPTKPALAGWAQRCTNEADGFRELFPRIEPAVIASIVDADDRLLIQHNRAWDNPTLYSVSAGFVEAGENLEHACRREAMEETGVRLGEVKYLGSQPWPYRASLMMAFKARALTTDIRVDGQETSDARWVTRDEYRDLLIAGQITAPGKATIARTMIEEWYGREL